jgi:hypothetical protein
MLPENDSQQPDGKKTSVNIGNASNPAPQPDDAESLGDNQVLSEGAEKYLREVASVEDYPDARDDEEMDKTIREDQ